MDGLLLVAAAAATLTGLGLRESRSLRRDRSHIPLRIHVNGTRGKSSVTRLIAAGLRAGGLRTCAKTTGTRPRFIYPDGSEEDVERIGRPNVIEQASVMRAARACDAQALVLECMAVNPLLQSLCELRIVQATHGVITNARPDHLDVMGPTPDDVARALAGTTPVRGALFTAERQRCELLSAAARDRGSSFHLVDTTQTSAISAHELSRFSYIEHADNVALALEVCRHIGVPRETALPGMWSAQPDPGVMMQYRCGRAGGDVWFLNCFAANDPQSTDQNWSLAVSRYGWAERRLAVINCRADRPDRSQQMAELCASWAELDRCLVIGSGVEVFVKRAVACGLAPLRIVSLEDASATEIFEGLNSHAGRSALVMGIGNIAGVGMELVSLAQQRHRAQDHSSVFSNNLQEAA